jgi:hypothetical protein
LIDDGDPTSGDESSASAMADYNESAAHMARRPPNYDSSVAALLDPVRVQPGVEWWCAGKAVDYPPENKVAKMQYFTRAIARAKVAPTRLEQWVGTNSSINVLGNHFLKNESVLVPDEHGNPKRRIKTAPLTSKTLMQAKVIGIYFARLALTHTVEDPTAELAGLYSAVRSRLGAKAFEVVFMSVDRDETSFLENFRKMPWLAAPFSNDEGDSALVRRSEAAARIFGVTELPALVLVDANGALITGEGLNCMFRDPEGIHFPWKPPPVRFFDLFEPPRRGEMDRVTAARTAKVREEELWRVLQESKCILLLMEGANKRTQQRALAAVTPLALRLREKRAMQPGAHPRIEWFVARKLSPLVVTLRKALGLPPPPKGGTAGNAKAGDHKGTGHSDTAPIVAGSEPLLMMLNVAGGGRVFPANMATTMALFNRRDTDRRTVGAKAYEKVRYPWHVGTPPELEGAPLSLNPLLQIYRFTRRAVAKHPTAAAAAEARRQEKMGHVFDDGEVVRSWMDLCLDMKWPHKQLAQWGTRLYFSTGVPSDKQTAGTAPGLAGHQRKT